MAKPYQPPFTISAKIVALVAAIGESVGRLSTAQQKSQLRLRRINRIKTIRGSLAIEGNTLSEAQITAILDGKPVIAPPREIMEARNALAAYEQLEKFRAVDVKHLLKAHALLMKGLADDAGHFRAGGVGVMQGKKVVHMAPPANRVPVLMTDLLIWLGQTEQHPLIASSVFHYEFEFIHPFSDGNGRMGRLWQTLILSQWNPLFTYVPVESLVHAHQTDYYKALSDSSAHNDCGVFIEFMLARLLEAINLHTQSSNKTPVKTPVKKPVKTADHVLALLNKQPTLTLAEIAAHLGKSTSAIERAARKLRNEGLLRYVGPQKGGRWEVKK